MTAAEIVPLVKARPKAKFLLLNGVGFSGSPLGKPGGGLPANYWIEISRLSAVMANEIAKLVQSLGADRLVFGTGMPFNAPDPSLVKMEVAGLGETEKEKISAKNMAGLLGLS